MHSVLRTPFRMLAGAGMAGALLCSAACDDDGPIVPPVATGIVIDEGDNQNIAVSTASEPLSVTVTDQFDDELPGVAVAWVVVSGDGTLNAATSTTNADGSASIIFTAGATPGTATVTATVAGLPAVTFTIIVE